MQEEMVQERVGQLVTLVFQEEEEIQVEEGVEAGEEIRCLLELVYILAKMEHQFPVDLPSGHGGPRNLTPGPNVGSQSSQASSVLHPT